MNFYFYLILKLTRSRSRNFDIPAPAPAKSSGSLRLRLQLHNTVFDTISIDHRTKLELTRSVRRLQNRMEQLVVEKVPYTDMYTVCHIPPSGSFV
jgi:hypothetical protein